MSRRIVAVVIGLAIAMVSAAAAAELPTLAGPAMGTTYRVVLAADVPGLARGEVHREVEAVLARIDRAASTWRDDSEASRFNRAAAGEWVEVGGDLAAIIAIAREVHAETDGGFDVTCGPLVQAWAREREPSEAELAAARAVVGMQRLESRPPRGDAPAALRKRAAGVTLDLGGIAPGYAVDAIGERLAAIGSRAHVVELGGEARAWGTRPDGTPWRLAVRGGGGIVELAAGEAVAFSTPRPGRGPVDPRTGRRPEPGASAVGPVMVRASTCAVADALAVARALGNGSR